MGAQLSSDKNSSALGLYLLDKAQRHVTCTACTSNL